MFFLRSLNLYILSLFFCVYAYSATYEKSNEFQLAKAGNVDAQYNVAMNFLNGEEGYPKDYNQAKRWFEIASKQGDASAQNALGIIYLRGLGGDKDLSKAEYYYRLAANKNHENAQLQLALILLNSKKGDNFKEAKEWLEKASLNGNIEAKNKLKEIENK
ncbi:tetratricopeptide repeat protein [Acinetobacter pittii]|uniref:tetratricopeptide repeat protein n=1 Tax=Acinetobacter pittii TaxID=48296 RepID=UPI001981CE9A|nr:tetratricopeptide repeat protein [Acinetobacter pittii]MBN6513326.1 sel1 repeat family protein [Acinetobacter pittii]WVH54984.1 tetratricopeptide repeat protein [Acinetobacter pittii]